MVKSRREFMKTVSSGVMGTVISQQLMANSIQKDAVVPVCVFTKCLQFTDFEKVGELLASAGFDGADLPVRPDGSIHPDRIATELPQAVKTLKKYGISVPMAVTAITNAEDPLTEKVLGEISQSGIRYYRTSYLLYDPTLTVQENLDNHKKTMEKLEKLNRKFNLHGAYQNHSGTRLGGPVWDLYWIVKDLDPAFFGVQYDFCHAICEGNVSWPIGMKLLSPWIKTVDIKDFLYTQVNGKWKITYVPLGTGMVDFDACLKQYIRNGITGPFSLHFEYNLGGAELGKQNPAMSLSEISSFLKKDCQWFQEKLRSSQIIS